MDRRRLIQAGLAAGALLALPGCRQLRDFGIPITVLRPGMAAGHALRGEQVEHRQAPQGDVLRVVGVAAGPEIGAGWKRTGERAGEYVAVLIDDPALPQPIRANLFRDDDTGSSWSLHWSRPRPREDRD